MRTSACGAMSGYREAQPSRQSFASACSGSVNPWRTTRSGRAKGRCRPGEGSPPAGESDTPGPMRPLRPAEAFQRDQRQAGLLDEARAGFEMRRVGGEEWDTDGRTEETICIRAVAESATNVARSDSRVTSVACPGPCRRANPTECRTEGVLVLVGVQREGERSDQLGLELAWPIRRDPAHSCVLCHPLNQAGLCFPEGQSLPEPTRRRLVPRTGSHLSPGLRSPGVHGLHVPGDVHAEREPAVAAGALELLGQRSPPSGVTFGATVLLSVRGYQTIAEAGEHAPHVVHDPAFVNRQLALLGSQIEPLLQELL